MKNNRLAVLGIMLTLLLMFQPEAFAGEFSLIKKDAGILLYERWIPNKGEIVRELKAVFTVRISNPEKVMLLLKDAHEGLKWNNNASKYQIVPGVHPDAWYAYILYDIPWPMDDFDCLLSYHYEPMGAGSAVIAFQSVSNSAFPILEDVSRIKGTKGKWILEQQGEVLKITYLVTTDRDKAVPRWISDPIIHDNLFKTMNRFKDLLEKTL